MKDKLTWTERDWTPVKRGPIYCSPACGAGCTKAAFDVATAAAKELATGLGSGWVPRVWENVGWFYEAHTKCGRVHIHPDHHPVGKRQHYTAFLNRDGGSGGEFIGKGSTPRKALADAFAKVRIRTNELQALLVLETL